MRSAACLLSRAIGIQNALIQRESEADSQLCSIEISDTSGALE